MTADLFDDLPPQNGQPAPSGYIQIAPGALLLRGFARSADKTLLQQFEAVCARAPLRHLVTPGGATMSVAMTNCGSLGWVSDRRGYRYESQDPLSGQPWPEMQPDWADLAEQAASTAGFEGFRPDACLVNQYLPGSRLSLHQDKDETDYSAPIVSVSLGLPAVFLFGTDQRTGSKVQRLRLVHGDVVVWGGPARLAFHGVAPLADGDHPLLGRQRINLTFRRAGPA